MLVKDNLLRMTVPVVEEVSAANIVVPKHGLAVSNPAGSFFYGLTGGDCKRHYKCEAEYAASRAGKKVTTVEIDVARPKKLNVPLEGLNGIRGLPVLHVRYMKRDDMDEFARLCEKSCASGARAGSRDRDWMNVFDVLVDHPEIVPLIFRKLKHLKILVLPMLTPLLSDPVWVAVVRTKSLLTDVRKVTAAPSSRRILHANLIA